MTTWVVDNGGGTITVATLDDIPDGSTYVKSENNFTDALKNKLDGVDTGATDDQTGDEMVTAVNASAGGLNADKLSAGTTNKLLTANEKAGAGYGYAHLDGSGIQAGVAIDGGALNISEVHDKASDALQKSTDTLDDISDGTTYERVKADNISSGNIVKIHDGTALRAIGTAENEIPLLGPSGRLPTARLEADTLVRNAGGTIERADGSAVTIDDMDDGSTYKKVPAAETKRIVIWQSTTEVRATGVMTYAPYKETSLSYVQKIAIPYLHSDDVKTLELKAWLRNSTGGSTSDAKMGVYEVDDSNGKAKAVVTIEGAKLSITGATWDTIDDTLDATSLVAGTHYLIVISLEASGNQAEMDHVMIAKNVYVVE